MNSKLLYEAIGYAGDRYLDMADDFLMGPVRERPAHAWKRRTLMSLLAAIICISLLAATAVATGWIPGLFDALKEKYPEDEELFEAAAQANTETVPEIAVIPEMDLSKFVLLERYYDGETILLGYDLEKILPEPVVGIEPEEAMLKNIRKSLRMSKVGWDSPQAWTEDPEPGYAAAYNFKQDGYLMDRMLKGTLSPEAYENAWDIMEEKGWVCVAVRDIYIGDHILINGQDLIDVYIQQGNTYNGITDYETEMGSCIRLEPIPEKFRNLEKLTVTFDVRSSLKYWYMDMDGNGRIYYDSSAQESKEVSFELERSKRNG